MTTTLLNGTPPTLRGCQTLEHGWLAPAVVYAHSCLMSRPCRHAWHSAPIMDSANRSPVVCVNLNLPDARGMMRVTWYYRGRTQHVSMCVQPMNCLQTANINMMFRSGCLLGATRPSQCWIVGHHDRVRHPRVDFVMRARHNNYSQIATLPLNTWLSHMQPRLLALTTQPTLGSANVQRTPLHNADTNLCYSHVAKLDNPISLCRLSHHMPCMHTSDTILVSQWRPCATLAP